MHRKHFVFFFLGFIFVFAVFFLYLVYDKKYNVFYPKPPIASYRIPPSDSCTFPGVYQYSFENISDMQVVSDEHAFSGKHALKISGKRNYSPVIEIKAGPELLYVNTARFGAWLWVDDASEQLDGKLVYQVVDKTNTLKYSAAINIQVMNGRARQWVCISGKADWGKNIISMGDIIKIYYWNNCKSNVYMDDVVAVFGEQYIVGEKEPDRNYFANITSAPSRNVPPCPTIFYRKELENNVIKSTLFSPDSRDSIGLTCNDRFYKGRFINTTGYCDQILMLRKGIPLALLWYNKEKSQLLFEKIPAIATMHFSAAAEYFAAEIDGDGLDELVTFSDNAQNLLIYKIQFQKPYLKLLTTCDMQQLGLTGNGMRAEPFLAIGKTANYIALLDGCGKLFLLECAKDKLKQIAVKSIPEAGSNRSTAKIICGRFLDSGQCDNILLLYKEKATRRCFYSMYGFNKQDQDINLIFHGSFDNRCDTLYPENSYYKCDIDNNGNDDLITFSNGWRFDAKTLRFDENEYVITSNIDFCGYQKDWNPKYYERTSFITGNFVEKNKLSVFACYSNLSNIADMEPSAGIFTYYK